MFSDVKTIHSRVKDIDAYVKASEASINIQDVQEFDDSETGSFCEALQCLIAAQQENRKRGNYDRRLSAQGLPETVNNIDRDWSPEFKDVRYHIFNLIDPSARDLFTAWDEYREAGFKVTATPSLSHKLARMTPSEFKALESRFKSFEPIVDELFKTLKKDVQATADNVLSLDSATNDREVFESLDSILDHIQARVLMTQFLEYTGMDFELPELDVFKSESIVN